MPLIHKTSFTLLVLTIKGENYSIRCLTVNWTVFCSDKKYIQEILKLHNKDGRVRKTGIWILHATQNGLLNFKRTSGFISTFFTICRTWIRCLDRRFNVYANFFLIQNERFLIKDEEEKKNILRKPP